VHEIKGQRFGSSHAAIEFVFLIAAISMTGNGKKVIGYTSLSSLIRLRSSRVRAAGALGEIEAH
jgi:hypothetical protein